METKKLFSLLFFFMYSYFMYGQNPTLLTTMHNTESSFCVTTANKSEASNAVRNITEVPTDTIPPTAPIHLEASVNLNSIYLNWEASTDNDKVNGYLIYDEAGNLIFDNGLELVYSANNLEWETTYTFSVAAYDLNGNISEMSSIYATTEAKPAGLLINSFAVAPIIDGYGNDSVWEVLMEEPISKLIDGTIDETFAATFKLGWDAKNFYMLLSVSDDKMDTTSGSADWAQDTFELYLDMDNSKSETYSKEDPKDAIQLSLVRGRVNLKSYPNESAGGMPNIALNDIVIGIVNYESNGYTYEISIPWKSLNNHQPATGVLLGFDILVKDNDGKSSPESILAWSTETNNAWEKPSVFGVIQLIGEVEVGIANQSLCSPLLVYPNPSDGSQIYFKAQGLTNKHLYIYTIQGQLTAIETINSDIYKINTTLKKGIYLIKVDNKITRFIVQ